VLATPDMALWLIWESLTFRMLKTAQIDRLWTSLIRRRQRDAIGSGGMPRRRVAFGDGVLVVCLFAFAGLLLLGSLVILLSWVTMTVPSRASKFCSEFERCLAPAADMNEPVSVDDPPANRLTITR